MSRDLERQLEEMGPAYRTVVARLRAARAVEPGGQRTQDSRQRPLSAVFCPLSYLVAASLLVLLGLGVIFFQSIKQSNTQTIKHSNNSPSLYTVRVTDARTELTLAELRGDARVKEIIRTQRDDGGWGSDELTRQNAELLKSCPDEAAQTAYRKAIGNLRARGLL